MSKILKDVELKVDQPLQLKNLHPVLIKRTKSLRMDSIEGKVAATFNRAVEDDANLLMKDAFDRSLEIVEDAKIEAKEIIAKAQETRSQIEGEAFQRGFQEGQSQGYQDGFEKSQAENSKMWKEHFLQFNQLRLQLKEQNQEMIEHMEQECIKMALYIAEKILKTALEMDLEHFISIIHQGLQKAGDQRDLVIRLQAEDYDRLTSIGDLSGLKNNVKNISLIKDPLLTKGDCIIEADHFEIDAGVHTQVKNLASVLEEMGIIRYE